MFVARTSLARLRPAAVGVAAVFGCAPPPAPAPVSPADIPALEAQVDDRPADAVVRFRLAAAYLTADRCDAAIVQATAGLGLEAENVMGPLIVGACQEKEERFDLAHATYQDFATRYPAAPGVAALRANALRALRRGAELAARQAVAREQELSAQPPEPATVAVLPLTIAGDTAYRALARGLAELITTDLATIRSLRLLERLHVGALLDELRLGQAGAVDSGTAARMGRMLRAERMIQGVAAIPSARATVRLQASVVTGDGAVRRGEEVSGPFPNLLQLEKRLVLDLGAQLGIELTAAERQRILEQGPKSLAAFLAYCDGLEALDRGDHAAAALHFGRAARAEPSFQAAHESQQAAEAAPLVERAVASGGVVTVVDAVRRVGAAVEPATRTLVSTSSVELSPTLGDAIRSLVSSGVDATVRQTTAETRGVANLQGTSAIIRIIFRRPR
jgi:TolB-like protein